MKRLLSILAAIIITQTLSAQIPFKGPNGQYGFKNDNGKVIIPCKYAEVHEAGFKEGLCAVKKDASKDWGFINTSGKTESSFIFSEVHKNGFTQGLCITILEGNNRRVVWVVNKEGTPVIMCEDDEVLFDPLSIYENDNHLYAFYEEYLSTETKSLEYASVGSQKKETNPSLQDISDIEVQKKSTIKNEIIQENAPEVVPEQKITVTPIYKNDNENTFAVIIANENYRRESEVEFALNDGQNFKEYCRLYLGLPQSNIHYVENATLNDMKAEINWITNVAEAYEGKAKLIFYYAGHGIPDEASRTAYLLPADGYGSDVSTGYKLDDLYSKLSSVPAEYAVAFLDACFSGGQRDGKMMASARGVAIKAKPAAPTGKLVVFSAAQGDETAYPYRDKQHGLFTYYLLEKIKETKGNVALGELADFLSGSVRKKSIVMNSKSQTPSVSASPEISNWNNLKLY